jgi:hypothetical protein
MSSSRAAEKTRDSESIVVDEVRGPALEWFTGKARDEAVEAFDLLAASEVAQEWLPGASRRVTAALGKSNVAHKLHKKYGPQLAGIGGYELLRGQRGSEVDFVLAFGLWKRGLDIDFDAIKRNVPNEEVAKVVELAKSFVSDFEPLVELIATLDATKPAPVITSIGASPTVTKLLKTLGLLLNIRTIRLPPIEWKVVERMTKDGKPYLAKVGFIKWPSGTVHDASRYAGGTAHNDQCHACGHAIRNVFNWVPLLLDNDEGIPHSLWVGRDCAETLFGIRVKGDFELAPS